MKHNHLYVNITIRVIKTNQVYQNIKHCLNKQLIILQEKLEESKKIKYLEKENKELKENSITSRDNFAKLALTSQKGNTNINNSSYIML